MRAGTVNRSDHNAVAVLAIDSPPVNALSSKTGVVSALLKALHDCATEAAIAAVVVCGSGRYFSAGADISDFGDDPANDVGPLRQLLTLLDDMTKPVVAALHGVAIGGGLELALACHWRICTEDTQISLPEVTLGLLPGGGGTQRLPRLAGAEAALDIMLSGRKVSAAEALKLGIIDQIVERDLLEQAVIRAKEIAQAGEPLRRARDLAVRSGGDFAAWRDAAAKRPGLGQAPRAIVDCVEAACASGFDDALAFEYRAFDRLMLSEESRGLRHAFLVERKASSIPGLPRPRNNLSTVAVIGAGTMGTGIATSLLDSGFDVILADPSMQALSRAVTGIERNIATAVERGRRSAEQAAAQRTRLSVVEQLEDTATAQLFIEAAFEDLAVKRGVFERLDCIAHGDAILATNTSTLDVDRIADSVKRPERVIGLHFFSPANVMKLLEIVRGPRTDPQIVADALSLARRIGKVGVVAGVCDGFIGNRIFEEYLRQAYFLLEEGALPAQIDRAIENWGFAMGPLRVMDLAGQDIGWNIRKRRAVEQPHRPYSRIPDIVCELGRFGQKTGAGYYLYSSGNRKGESDPEIDAMIVAHSASLGIARRDVSDEEIVERCIFAMVNEGARILEEGVAARPLDIDAVYLNGYGYPRFRGGPMFYADRAGLPAVLERIDAFARGYQGWAWTPSPLLVALVHSGKDFATLNG